jgi:hypothetical protein
MSDELGKTADRKTLKELDPSGVLTAKEIEILKEIDKKLESAKPELARDVIGGVIF